MGAVVQERMYVDDHSSSSATMTDETQEASTMKPLLCSANLNLQSWVSNYKDLMRAMANGEKAEPKIHPLGDNGEEKELGVLRETCSDTLGLKVTNESHPELFLMDMVSRAAGVFDPLGTAIIVKKNGQVATLSLPGFCQDRLVRAAHFL